MTIAQTRVFPHIVRDAAILGGEPIVTGTRVPVRSIAILCRLYHSKADVRAALPMLTSEMIDEALAFYGEHWEEIEQHIAANDDDADV